MEADLHIHTIASGDAFGTIKDALFVARKKNLKAIAITEHGPAMPCGPHKYYFNNMELIPRNDGSIKILKGVEANIMDRLGNLDLEEVMLKKMDIVIAGFHTFALKPLSRGENTEALVKAIRTHRIHVIAHLNYSEYPVDEEVLFPVMKERDVALEINEGALLKRRDTVEPFIQTLKKANRIGIKFIVSSDAHYPDAIGKFVLSHYVIKKAGIDESQILNRNVKLLYEFLKVK